MMNLFSYGMQRRYILLIGRRCWTFTNDMQNDWQVCDKTCLASFHKKAFSSSRYHSTASIYHSVVCTWPIIAMFQGCSWNKTRLDQNTTNAGVNNVLDDKSTRIKN